MENKTIELTDEEIIKRYKEITNGITNEYYLKNRAKILEKKKIERHAKALAEGRDPTYRGRPWDSVKKNMQIQIN